LDEVGGGTVPWPVGPVHGTLRWMVSRDMWAMRAAGIRSGVGQTVAGGRHQFANQLGEDHTPLGVLRALAVHDDLELGMSISCGSPLPHLT
jgi:hypothetical protein